mmetsp:Transcript_10704/g.43307  ORF Transcript_10704/g.43307 Transcript_10704/m.43307 type:complete len:208 (+) Transcript_10704:1102-1725(+)
MAYTSCPTRSSDDEPTLTGRSTDPGAATLRTAMSFSGSAPTSTASYDAIDASSPAPSPVTEAFCAWLMTWKFVTTWPSRSHTKPDPVPAGTSITFIVSASRCSTKVSMKTTEGVLRSNKATVSCSTLRRFWFCGAAGDAACATGPTSPGGDSSDAASAQHAGLLPHTTRRRLVSSALDAAAPCRRRGRRSREVVVASAVLRGDSSSR